MLSIASAAVLMPLQLLSTPSLAQVSMAVGKIALESSLQSVPFATMPAGRVHERVIAPAPKPSLSVSLQ